jgi:regulatory protein RepA
MSLDELAPILTRRVYLRWYDATIIDPIYKVITGDENNVSDMGAFTNFFVKISKETGCTIILYFYLVRYFHI